MTLFSVAVGWPHTPVPGLIVEELRSLALKVDSVYRIIRSKLSNIRIVCTIRIVGASTDDLKKGSQLSMSLIMFVSNSFETKAR